VEKFKYQMDKVYTKHKSQSGDSVSEEKIKSIVYGFGEAFVKRDVEKMRSGFRQRARSKARKK